MNIAIDQETLSKALEKGGYAALSDIAQSDNSNMALLLKSVKITTSDENVVIESSNPVFSTKTIIPATKTNGVIVEDKGAIFVEAKGLVSWVKAQGKGSTIKIVLDELDTHESISFEEEDETKSFSITKIGNVKVLSKDDNKTTGKWGMDCYDPSHANSVSYNDDDKKLKLFAVSGSEFETAINSIKFSSFLQDTSLNLENVSIQNSNGKIYFATTDKKRCSLYKIESAVDITSDSSVLVSADILSQISKILDKESNAVVHYNKDLSKVFISQDSFESRISCPDESTINSYPNIALLLNKKHDKLGVINRTSFNKMLSTVALVNNHSALYTFKEDKLKIQALSEQSGCKPSTVEAPVHELSEETVAVISVKHLREFLKQVKSEDITLSMSADKKSLTAIGNSETNFIYFVMSIKNSLYDSLLNNNE